MNAKIRTLYQRGPTSALTPRLGSAAPALRKPPGQHRSHAAPLLHCSRRAAALELAQEVVAGNAVLKVTLAHALEADAGMLPIRRVDSLLVATYHLEGAVSPIMQWHGPPAPAPDDLCVATAGASATLLESGAMACRLAAPLPAAAFPDGKMNADDIIRVHNQMFQTVLIYISEFKTGRALAVLRAGSHSPAAVLGCLRLALFRELEGEPTANLGEGIGGALGALLKGTFDAERAAIAADLQLTAAILAYFEASAQNFADAETGVRVPANYNRPQAYRDASYVIVVLASWSIDAMLARAVANPGLMHAVVACMDVFFQAQPPGDSGGVKVKYDFPVLRSQALASATTVMSLVYEHVVEAFSNDVFGWVRRAQAAVIDLSTRQGVPPQHL